MRKQKKPRILTFAILTTITIVTWAVFDVLRTFTKPAPVEVDSKITRQLDPKLDQKTISNIKNRRFFTDDQARIFVSQVQEVETEPTPEPTLPPIATLSGEVNQ